MEWFLIVIVVIAAVAYDFYRRRRRRLAMKRFADALEWVYQQGPVRDFDANYSHPAFHEGHGHRARNVIRGRVPTLRELSTTVVLGDYEFTTGSGDDTQTHRFSFLVFELPLVMLPGLTVRHEWFGDRIAAALGFDDIDFESDEFNRRFVVKSANKRFAYDIVHPRMMEFMLGTRPPRLELRDDVLLVWHSQDAKWSPDEFRKQLAWSREFLGLWPEFVIEQYLPPAGRQTA